MRTAEIKTFSFMRYRRQTLPCAHTQKLLTNADHHMWRFSTDDVNFSWNQRHVEDLTN